MPTAEKLIPFQDLVVLPGGTAAELCRVVRKEVFPIAELAFDHRRPHLLGGNHWLVAILEVESFYTTKGKRKKGDGGNTLLYRARVNPDGSLSRGPELRLPSQFLNQTLAIKGDILYLGGYQMDALEPGQVGKNCGELAGFVDLSLAEPVWHPLSLPVALQPGKSIDDLVVYDDKLVLVDNILFPKYLFAYDISQPDAPIAPKTIRLPNNGTYEHISSACSNGRWLAIRSSGVGRLGSSQYVSVLGLPGFEQVLTVERRRAAEDIVAFARPASPDEAREQAEAADTELDMLGFTLVRDSLLVACGYHGIAVFPLEGMVEEYRHIEKENEERMKTAASDYKVRYRPGRHIQLPAQPNGEIRLHKPDGLDESHKLLRLNDDRVVVVEHKWRGSQAICLPWGDLPL